MFYFLGYGLNNFWKKLNILGFILSKMKIINFRKVKEFKIAVIMKMCNFS